MTSTIILAVLSAIWAGSTLIRLLFDPWTGADKEDWVTRLDRDSKPKLTPQPTADEKLAATLASAQQLVYDSLALVNPLRLQVWQELNLNIPEQEKPAEKPKTVKPPGPPKSKASYPNPPIAPAEATPEAIHSYTIDVGHTKYHSAHEDKDTMYRNIIKHMGADLERNDHRVNDALHKQNKALRKGITREHERATQLHDRVQKLLQENSQLHNQLGDTPIYTYGEPEPVRWKKEYRTR